MERVEEHVATRIWIEGVSKTAHILWVTHSHAEILIEDGFKIAEDQLVAVIVRGFLSLPMRVISQHGGNLVLSFVQRPHASVLELIDRQLREAGVKAMRDLLEEHALPANVSADLEAWQGEAEFEDTHIAELFRMRVLELEIANSASHRLVCAA